MYHKNHSNSKVHWVFVCFFNLDIIPLAIYQPTNLTPPPTWPCVCARAAHKSPHPAKHKPHGRQLATGKSKTTIPSAGEPRPLSNFIFKQLIDAYTESSLRYLFHVTSRTCRLYWWALANVPGAQWCPGQMSGSAFGPFRIQWSSSGFMNRLSTHSTFRTTMLYQEAVRWQQYGPKIQITTSKFKKTHGKH